MLYCLQCWHENNGKKKKASVPLESALWLLNFPIVSWHTQSETPLKPEQCEKLPRGIGSLLPHHISSGAAEFDFRNVSFPLLLFISCPTSVVPQRLTCLARPAARRRSAEATDGAPSSTRFSLIKWETWKIAFRAESKLSAAPTLIFPPSHSLFLFEAGASKPALHYYKSTNMASPCHALRYVLLPPRCFYLTATSLLLCSSLCINKDIEFGGHTF